MFEANTTMDAETAALLASLERGLAQAARGERAMVHTPEQIAARRKAGRPVGSVQARHRKAITLRLDEEVLESWRASGKGWQTRAVVLIAMLKACNARHPQPRLFDEQCCRYVQ